MGYICAKNNANYPQNEAGMMVLRKKCHAVTKIRFSNITQYCIENLAVIPNLSNPYFMSF